jgi:DNA invertase Pin-like site-specific DNA recombinase
MPGKITPEHLSKIIIIYIRQSSQHQVQRNTESQALQYKLAERAKQLGWPAQKIVILDNDLGVTATGVKKRQDFDDLLQRLCSGEVGAVMFFSASRLASRPCGTNGIRFSRWRVFSPPWLSIMKASLIRVCPVIASG